MIADSSVGIVTGYGLDGRGSIQGLKNELRKPQKKRGCKQQEPRWRPAPSVFLGMFEEGTQPRAFSEPLGDYRFVWCYRRTDYANLVVRAGPVLRGILGTLRNVSLYVPYPGYDDQIMDYDIALVKLSEDIPFDSTIDSLDIGTEVPFDGNVATVSGWGATSSGAWLSSVLNERNVTILYFNDCKYLYEGIQNPVTERMFCAGSRDGGPCQGDPGDPLVYNEQLIGLMSWSFGCGDGKYPAVYTDVTKFRGWIADYAGLTI
ncbi:hypothetical protein B7P43_G08500 [Cryptotermes secundus]|uniref:Peptidase S1 domain-containing protein n=1 Tax=Cryptotermes secundus TaxID=105785 RepID=A0A2J7RJM7_9NEOP|nr:hypothetical protein B7P43_G08500 [Cryptotermes secundus]